MILSQPDFIYLTVIYELSDVLNDLMCFSAEHLRPEGRLVFWLPTIRGTDNGVPHHPHLRLIANSEQPFGQCNILYPWNQANPLGSRSLLTYVKTDPATSVQSIDGMDATETQLEFRQMVIPSYSPFWYVRVVFQQGVAKLKTDTKNCWGWFAWLDGRDVMYVDLCNCRGLFLLFWSETRVGV